MPRPEADLDDEQHDWLTTVAKEQGTTHGQILAALVDWARGEQEPHWVDACDDLPDTRDASVEERLTALEERLEMVESQLGPATDAYADELVARLRDVLEDTYHLNSTKSDERIAALAAARNCIQKHGEVDVGVLKSDVYPGHDAGLGWESWAQLLSHLKELDEIEGPTQGGRTWRYVPEGEER